MSNRLSAMGLSSLNNEWAAFAAEHSNAAEKAWQRVEAPTDWTDTTEADYMRRLITCGWRMLDEEIKARANA